MAAHPVAMMAAASACAAALLLVAMGADRWPPIVLGSVAPLAASLASWTVVARVHATAPERVAAAMIKLFAAKMVWFGAYVAAVVVAAPEAGRAFALAFVAQYVVLHLMEAWYLRRLFAARETGPRPAGLR